MDDYISRQAAIGALWKALYDYEDRTEKQFIESDELDVGEWIQHRIFVQNMNDMDRQTILNLPSVDAVEVVRCKDCIWRYHDVIDGEETDWCGVWANQTQEDAFCSYGKRAI